jgi:diguanylate cyclase (GGDEF)-like protein
MRPPFPANETERVGALRELNILDSENENEYDDIVLLASQICGTPIAAITLIDESRQWFKARIGIDDPETPRNDSFCAHAIWEPGVTLVVEDATQDERFSDNPAVTGEFGLRFYAGAPLVTRDNFALGALCVGDKQPRNLSDTQLRSLEALARQLTLRLELRRASNLLAAANEELKTMSLTDELTGLYNARGFMIHAEQQLKLFRSRAGERSLYLLFADLDGLKAINDKFGHAEGSAAIAAAADILRRTLRDADIIARQGGDEFVALLPNTLDIVAETLPTRLEKTVAEHNVRSGKDYQVGMSLGMVRVEFDSNTTLDELIKAADQKMYENKVARKAQRV